MTSPPAVDFKDTSLLRGEVAARYKALLDEQVGASDHVFIGGHALGSLDPGWLLSM